MASGTQIQKWGSYEPEAAAREKKETERKGAFYKIKQNKVTLRFLPPKHGRNSPFVMTWQHFVEMVPGDERTTVITNCPKKMMKQACPLCAMAQKKFNTGKESDKKRGYELRAKMRIYAAIVDRADEDKGVQTFPFGQQIFEQLTNIRDDGDFTHPTEGFDITIFRKGTGQKDTEYDVKPSRKESPMHEDAAMMDEWFEQLPDLLSNAHVPSTQEVVDKIQEAADRADEEAGSDNGSDRRQRGRSSAGGGGRSSSGGGRGADESAAAGPRERRASTVSDDTDFVDTDGEDVDGEGAAVEGEEGQEDLWR